MISFKNIYRNKVVAGLFSCSLLLAPCSFTSCSNEDYLGGHFVTEGAGTFMNVSSSIEAEGMTWNEGDVIGISTSYGISDATARNRQYTCQANGNTFAQSFDNPIYVKGNCIVTAYYPFVGSDGAEPTLNLNTLDQQNVTDYLFARVEGVTRENGGQVNLPFKHALARLQVAITAPAGEVIKSCRISGLAQKATVDAYTLDLTLDSPEDLVVKAADLKSFTLKLIPQTIDANIMPARMVLVGSTRSYAIDLNDLQLTGGQSTRANIDVTSGVATVEFVPVGSQWTDSGLGGNVSSN